MTPPEHTHADAALTAIRARVEAITPGEWKDIPHPHRPNWWHNICIDTPDAENVVIADVYVAVRGTANAAFMAAAPADIRLLLATVASLERQLADAQARERAAVEALKPFANINQAYLESEHIRGSDFDTHYWDWIHHMTAPAYARRIFEGAVKANAALAAAAAPADSADDGSGGEG